MGPTVSTASIICMTVSCIIGFAIPFGLFFLINRKTKADTAPFFIGCLTFLVFAMILESGFHNFMLGTSVGRKISTIPLYYAVYGGICAGLFEEFGRLIAFKTVMKRYTRKDDNALMYGAGHGGLEAMMILGLSMLNNISYSLNINDGKLEKIKEGMQPEVLASLQNIVNQLVSTPSWQFLLGGVERITACLLQIALSLLVWVAVTKKDKFYFFPLAILIHFLVDTISVILAMNGINIILVEVMIIVMTAASAFFAWNVWKSNKEEAGT